MAADFRNTPPSLLDEQRAPCLMGGSDRMSVYDYYMLRNEQPSSGIDPSVTSQDSDLELIDPTACESPLFISDDCDYDPNAAPENRAPLTRQNIQAKKEEQDNDTTMAADEGAATAVEATTAVFAPANLSSTEMHEMLMEKEEFSLLAKKKILVGAARYKRSLRLVLQEVEAAKAESQSSRATAQESQKAIIELTRRLDSNEKAIVELTQRLEVAEAENRRLRARADTQKDINKDVKAAIVNLQHGMAMFAGGA